MSEALIRDLDEETVEQLKACSESVPIEASGGGQPPVRSGRQGADAPRSPRNPTPETDSQRSSRAQYRELADRVRAALGERPQADSAALLAEEALAMQVQTRLVTADETLYNALKDGPLGALILWVEDA